MNSDSCGNGIRKLNIFKKELHLFATLTISGSYFLVKGSLITKCYIQIGQKINVQMEKFYSMESTILCNHGTIRYKEDISSMKNVLITASDNTSLKK